MIDFDLSRQACRLHPAPQGLDLALDAAGVPQDFVEMHAGLLDRQLPTHVLERRAERCQHDRRGRDVTQAHRAIAQQGQLPDPETVQVG